MKPFRPILASLLAAIAVAMVLPAIAPASIVTRDIAKSPAAVRHYWTKAKMRDAEPVPVEPATPSASASGPAEDEGAPTYVAPAAPGAAAAATLERGTAVAPAAKRGEIATPVVSPGAAGVRTHGKVFFTVQGGTEPGNFVCSGTAVNSRNKSLVWTAGHCVYDSLSQGGKSVNFVFVPAYKAGAAPYGEWSAVELGTTREWKRDVNLRYDMGAVVVSRLGGKTLGSVVGGRGIGFDQPRRQNYDVFGYPAVLPFTGELEYECRSPFRGSDVPSGTGPKTMRVGCDMTAGSSGGGWIANGVLLSDTSYGYPPTPYLYGPYLSQTAKKLYKRVGR